LGTGKATGLIAAGLLAGLAAAFWQEIPRWRIGGTASAPTTSVSYTPGPLPCPETGGTIAIFGDSHVAGSRMGERGEPFGTVAERDLGGRATIALYGVGGHTAAMGEAKWGRGNLPKAGLVLLAFGTNDAAPRGLLRNKTPVPIANYKAAMTRQISAWRARGAQIAVVAPPPAGSIAINHRLAPYRTAAREIGQAEKVPVLDPADAFASCRASEPLLTYDALHMNPAGHQCLGRWLARQLCPRKAAS
jgi:lysophospholipase L1-like esterase